MVLVPESVDGEVLLLRRPALDLASPTVAANGGFSCGWCVERGQYNRRRDVSHPDRRIAGPLLLPLLRSGAPTDCALPQRVVRETTGNTEGA